MASIDVRPQIVIRRARADVAAFMFHPENDLAWTTGVVECRPLTEGPLRQGSRVVRVAKFLGRRFEYGYEVVDAEPARFVQMKVEQPFPMNVRYELEDVPGGTSVSIRAEGDPGRFFSLAGPLLARMVHRNISRDLELLRKSLEARDR